MAVSEDYIAVILLLCTSTFMYIHEYRIGYMFNRTTSTQYSTHIMTCMYNDCTLYTDRSTCIMSSIEVLSHDIMLL